VLVLIYEWRIVNVNFELSIFYFVSLLVINYWHLAKMISLSL